MKRAYFTTCAECGGPHPNEKGVCSRCEVEHGYANDNRVEGCDCPSCRSDMARIAPCMKDAAHD